MDFIEQLLGISPDNGSGATELALASLPVLVLFLLALRRYFRRG